jgi:hypothetical protein
VEYHRGYFKADLEGIYNFTINSDDSSSMYLSQVANSSDRTALNQIISLTGYSPSPTNPYILGQANQFGTAYLLQGYYYFEVYHQNTGGLTHLSISVETPNVDPEVQVTAW